MKIKLFFDLRDFEACSQVERRRGAFWAILNMLRHFAKRSDVELKIIDSSHRNVYEIRKILSEFGLSIYMYDYSERDVILTYPRYKIKHCTKITKKIVEVVDCSN